MTGTGRPPVTAFWYPGFVPANAFALTGDGLVWTVDHLPVAAPGPGAGRHFVGRGLQRTARTVDDAVGYLRSRPSAGGFAYTIGDRAGPGGERRGRGWPPRGHRSRARRRASCCGTPTTAATSPAPSPRPTARARPAAATLDALGVPATDPGPSWFLDILTGPPPGGVRSDPGPDGRGLTTLCTLVADLTAGEAVIAARGEPPVTIPLADLAEGNPRPRGFSRIVQF